MFGVDSEAEDLSIRRSNILSLHLVIVLASGDHSELMIKLKLSVLQKASYNVKLVCQLESVFTRLKKS